MLFKLSLTGMRSRFKDYLVLFSGLIVTSAIFYMFLSLSLNSDFLNQNPSVDTLGQIFLVGNAFLGIITLVYVTYANSFLLSMRQRDYGLFMMLGAKSSKIGNLIFIETLFLGILAAVIGSFLGIFATQGVANLLVTNLGFSMQEFIGFNLSAILWTLLFFFVLFFLSALFNRLKISATSILGLLQDDQKPVNYHRNIWVIIGQLILGVSGLGIAYYKMMHISDSGPNVEVFFGTVFVSLIIGTYFTFNALIPFCIDALRKIRFFSQRKLTNFTLNQLKFRVTSYTRILSAVSLLFAMAVGAIAVALMLRDTAFENSDTVYYDVHIHKNSPEVETELSKLQIKDKVTFNYKVSDGKVYGISSELEQPIWFKEVDMDATRENRKETFKVYSSSGDKVKNYVADMLMSSYNANTENSNDQLYPETDENGQITSVIFMTQSQFNQIKSPEQSTMLIRTTDFRNQLLPLQKINTLQKQQTKYHGLALIDRIDLYQNQNSVLSVFQFIGFFLGLSFLTMLASILIFKILSGAHQDKKRYEMLSKIGAKRKTMINSIAKELAVLFILPGTMGVVHMLFALRFFDYIISNVYSRVVFPLVIFLVMYFLYYLLTLIIYCSIVLPKRK